MKTKAVTHILSLIVKFLFFLLQVYFIKSHANAPKQLIIIGNTPYIIALKKAEGIKAMPDCFIIQSKENRDS